MKINVIIFGCDNTGKTTLADNLVKYLTASDVPCTKVKSLGPAKMGEQVKFMDDMVAKRDDRNYIQIFDRFPIVEEEVCGVVLRNKNHFASYPSYVDKMLNHINLFIHCDPGLEEITKWGDREQMKGIKENAKELNELYEAFPYIHGIEARTMNYNFKRDNWQEIAKILVFYFNYQTKGKYYEY